MNPLSLPSSIKAKTTALPRLPVRPQLPVPVVEKKPQLVVEVSGLSASNSGRYVADYEDGKKLGYYLSEMGLKYAAIYAAVYDRTRPERGRLRMTYIPHAESQIAIGPAQVGLNSHKQRAQADAWELMAKMK